MIDAAAIDALDALESCPCCLLGPQQRCLFTPYTHLDQTEIYSDMLKESLGIQLNVSSDKCGICEECVVRLRDASHFKRQVRRSQAQLRARLERALRIIDNEPAAAVKSEPEDEETVESLSGEEPAAAVETESADDGGGRDQLSDEEPVEADERDGVSEDCVADEEPVEADERDGVSEDCVAAARALSMSARTRRQLAMSCSVRLERLHACPTCPATFDRESSLATHVKREHAACERDTCGELFERKRSLLALTQGHRGDTGRPRTVTPKEVRNKSGVSNRKRTQTGERPYSCEMCNKRYIQKGHLRRHIRTHTGEKPYKCETCNNRFTQKINMIAHMSKHTGEKLFSCEICSKQFTFKSSLRSHIRIHTGEKPYKCETCNKQFSRQGHLKDHIRIHTGELFSCKICNKQFSNQGYFKQHIKIHTGELFSCKICNKQFSHQGNFKQHIKIHTGEKRFTCEICSKQFTLKGNLKRHIIRTHT